MLPTTLVATSVTFGKVRDNIIDQPSDSRVALGKVHPPTIKRNFKFNIIHYIVTTRNGPGLYASKQASKRVPYRALFNFHLHYTGKMPNWNFLSLAVLHGTLI